MPMVFGSHFWTPGLTPFSTRRGTRRGHPGTRKGHPGTRGGHPGTRVGHPGTRGGHPGTRIGPSWDAYGPVWDVCGPVWVACGPAWVACGPAWDACGPAWVAYGPTGPGNVLHACDVTLRAPPTNVFGPAHESRENQFLGRRRSSAFCRGAFTACFFFENKTKERETE